jgi:hypothetical protein
MLFLAPAAAAAAPATITSIPPAATPGPVQLVPGLSYQRLAGPGPQVVHVLRLRVGGRLTLSPALTAGTPARRARLTDLIHSRLDLGDVAGVNGDYFNLGQAYPSGLLLMGGEIVSEPEPTRSALTFPPDGRLAVARLQLAGRFQAIDPAGVQRFPIRAFGGVNRPAERGSEAILYTPRYGTATPTGNSRFEALIGLDGGAAALVNAVPPLGGTVVSTRSGGGTPLVPGQVVLTGVGATGRTLASDLVPGRRVSLDIGLPGIAPGTLNGIGGGPALVRDGVVIEASGEGFTSSQLGARTSRTAVGQTADGLVLLVTAEGPDQGSRGVSVAEQAGLMASLGARNAIGMDSGGSAIMSLYDRLAIPWASERPITDALVANYTGVQIVPLSLSRLTPNGDGIDERTQALVRSAAPGTLTLTIARRGGGRRVELTSGPFGPGSRLVDIDPRDLALPDGPYQLTARLLPSDGTAPSSQARPIVVDRTLAGLRLRPAVVRRGGRRRPELQIAYRLVRPAQVTIRVQDSGGRVLRVLRAARRETPGAKLVTWDRTLRRKPAAAGVYTIAVQAVNSLGTSGLLGSVTLRR